MTDDQLRARSSRIAIEANRIVARQKMQPLSAQEVRRLEAIAIERARIDRELKARAAKKLANR